MSGRDANRLLRWGDENISTLPGHLGQLSCMILRKHEILKSCDNFRKCLACTRGLSIGKQPGTKSGGRPADKLDMRSRSSTGRFVSPSVYIGFRFFVLPKSRSGQLFSMVWRARGMVVSWGRTEPSTSRRASSHGLAALPCVAPHRIVCDVLGLRNRKVTEETQRVVDLRSWLMIREQTPICFFRRIYKNR